MATVNLHSGSDWPVNSSIKLTVGTLQAWPGEAFVVERGSFGLQAGSLKRALGTLQMRGKPSNTKFLRRVCSGVEERRKVSDLCFPRRAYRSRLKGFEPYTVGPPE